ncbi:MAG: FAD-binding oxidoreductase [Alphaproteobacteria bacterium]|nr:FAD-binding oxidoreductase [Alphaproteobacteria bacterium]MCZ6741634.1 FAD-binding oxidoreductase [Alphaproteobacteria bacterium]
MAISEETLARLLGAVGDRGMITDPGDMVPYVTDHRDLFEGAAAAVLRPVSTEETAAVVTICAETGTSIVPQGGNTGLVGGSVPDASGDAVVLNLGRMNKVRELDPLNNTMTVEAGCILADLQTAAADADRLFPLSLGAEGSCMIGGNLSTNAGGVGVLKFGNARDLVLGLEVVLPDGRVWPGLSALRKDNTGYDLKHLFIGAEGTLGVITAAVLKLFPRPAQVETAFMAVPELDNVLRLLADARAASGDGVTAFELLPRIGVELVLKHFEGTRAPMDTVSPWYVLMEWSAGESGAKNEPEAGLRRALEAFLEARFEAGMVIDAVLASSEAQAKELWHFREVLPECETREGASIKHDVSVPVSKVADFIAEGTRLLEAYIEGVRVFPFGHVGDGNIHFNVSQPVAMTKDEFHAHRREMNRMVHDLVMAMGGSFSAEHGIGRFKKGELAHYGEPLDLELMRRIKAAFDPDGIMNPGKVL